MQTLLPQNIRKSRMSIFAGAVGLLIQDPTNLIHTSISLSSAWTTTPIGQSSNRAVEVEVELEVEGSASAS